MHNHKWVIIPTIPVDPMSKDSILCAERYAMTAICTVCGKKMIKAPRMEFHETGDHLFCMQAPVSSLPSGLR